MAEHVIETPPNYLAKAKVVASIINQVGTPTVIILVFLAIAWAIVFGIAPSPFLSTADFKAHVLVNDEIHNAMINNSTAQADSIRQITIVLKQMECDMKKHDAEKLACFRNLSP